MGCSNPKEKIENEMLKMKMKRIELQMERYRELQKLKDIEGFERKPPIIPDYIDPKYINSKNKNNKNTQNLINNNEQTVVKDNNVKFIRRSNKSQSLAYKKNTKIFNFDENDKEDKENKENRDIKVIRKNKKRHTNKRKTMKY